MQYTTLLAVAAFALTASANPGQATVLGGALKGLSAANKRDSPSPAQSVAPPALAGAMKGLVAGIKRDEPYIPEWAPGQSVVQEAPMSEFSHIQSSASSSPSAVESAHQGHEQATGSAAQPHATSVPPVSSAAAPSRSTAAPPAVPSASSARESSAAPAPVSVSASVGVPASSAHSASVSSAHTTAAPSEAASSPSVAAGPASKGPLTINIVNKMKNSITISYQLGTYSTAGAAPTVASQLLGVSETTGTFATSTQVVAPVGWAGRMTIGKAGGELDFRGTKLEGNNGFDGADPNADPDPDFDVSYVDGYSVPASCSCGNDVITGCNKELFDLGIKCDNLAGDSAHPVCVNDPRNAHGPANPFFAPCAGAAYTYDYNDVANWQGTCPGNTINCCIGTDCPAPKRQPAGNSKREVMALIGARKRSAALAEA